MPHGKPGDSAGWITPLPFTPYPAPSELLPVCTHLYFIHTQIEKMFARSVTRSTGLLARGFASSARAERKVAVLGAAGMSSHRSLDILQSPH